MSDLAKLHEVELSQRILEMATAGVYRESLFDTFSGVASFRTLLEAAISPVSTDDVATRLRKLTEAVQILVRVSGGVAIALLISGSLCVLNGQLTLAATLWSATLAVSLVWMLQKLLVGSLLES